MTTRYERLKAQRRMQRRIRMVVAERRIARTETPKPPSDPEKTIEIPLYFRKEVEGVFVLREGRGVFTPIKTGIAGEKYFEVVSGLQSGDQVITGPFASVRELADGEEVKLAPPPRSATARR